MVNHCSRDKEPVSGILSTSTICGVGRRYADGRGSNRHSGAEEAVGQGRGEGRVRARAHGEWRTWNTLMANKRVSEMPSRASRLEGSMKKVHQLSTTSTTCMMM
eukprot:scaffold15499_cov29-Tisochrysis_lutea.AAC.3